MPDDASLSAKSPADVKLPAPGEVSPWWWLRSRTVYGAITLAIAFLLSKVRGVAVTPQDQQALDLADMLIAAIGFGLTLWGRWEAQRRLHGNWSLVDELRELLFRATEPEPDRAGQQERPRKPDGSIDYGMLPPAVPPRPPTVAPLIAVATVLLLGGCKTSEPAFYLRGDFLITAGIFAGLWLLGGFFLIRGIRNAPTGNDGDDGGRDQDNHGAE